MNKKCINCIYCHDCYMVIPLFFCRKKLIHKKRMLLTAFNSCPEFKARNDYDLILPKEIN